MAGKLKDMSRTPMERRYSANDDVHAKRHKTQAQAAR